MSSLKSKPKHRARAHPVSESERGGSRAPLARSPSPFVESWATTAGGGGGGLQCCFPPPRAARAAPVAAATNAKRLERHSGRARASSGTDGRCGETGNDDFRRERRPGSMPFRKSEAISTSPYQYQTPTRAMENCKRNEKETRCTRLRRAACCWVPGAAAAEEKKRVLTAAVAAAAVRS